MRRILVVDDNPDILEILQLILEDNGYGVETLSNGHDLLNKIQTANPDLILLDIMLGDMDGRELCKEVKSQPDTSNIPVILISASHNKIEVSSKADCLPNDFIAKPFDINVLVNKVERQLAA